MGQQTRTFQKQIVERYQRLGQLDQLYYYVELELPTRVRPNPQARYMPATYPAGHIPVINLAPDPNAAREWAHLLLELFKTSNPGRGFFYELCLTDANALAGWYWYNWGEESTTPVDKVCALCGMIHTVPANEEATCDCAAPSGADALGLYRRYNVFVDGCLYTLIPNHKLKRYREETMCSSV